MVKRQAVWMGALLVGALLTSMIGFGVDASDHDDGETDCKARALNLTDLYVFREGDQTGNAGDNSNLIFIMNTNPRSVARQQYYFSTNARYEFHISRRNAATDAVTASDDVTLRFEFSAPDAQQQQAMTVTAIMDGQTFTSTIRSDNMQPIQTTALTTGADVVNPVDLNGSTLTVFSGLKEDPFFFDVEQYFRVRAFALGNGPTASFKVPADAVDFAAGYNVNSIVVRVPIAFLQGPTAATTFDVWETISVLQ